VAKIAGQPLYRLLAIVTAVARRMIRCGSMPPAAIIIPART
jgi:hypothetical protein